MLIGLSKRGRRNALPRVFGRERNGARASAISLTLSIEGPFLANCIWQHVRVMGRVVRYHPGLSPLPGTQAAVAWTRRLKR